MSRSAGSASIKQQGGNLLDKLNQIRNFPMVIVQAWAMRDEITGPGRQLLRMDSDVYCHRWLVLELAEMQRERHSFWRIDRYDNGDYAHRCVCDAYEDSGNMPPSATINLDPAHYEDGIRVDLRPIVELHLRISVPVFTEQLWELLAHIHQAPYDRAMANCWWFTRCMVGWLIYHMHMSEALFDSMSMPNLNHVRQFATSYFMNSWRRQCKKTGPDSRSDDQIYEPAKQQFLSYAEGQIKLEMRLLEGTISVKASLFAVPLGMLIGAIAHRSLTKQVLLRDIRVIMAHLDAGRALKEMTSLA